MRTALRDCPDVLAGINFDLPKREAADEIVDCLMRQERKYQNVTLRLMMEVADRTDFSELEGHENGEELAAKARAKVAVLKRTVSMYESTYIEQQRLEAEQTEMAERMAIQRRFSNELDDLRAVFLAMHDELGVTPQDRGKKFEQFLNRVFELFDLEPRLAYSLEREQLDGAFSFDTDDYIVEAKWRRTTVTRPEADVFDAKVKRKGRNALGLMISIDGFTRDAIAEYSTRATFITMDGADLMGVLTGQVRLEYALHRKKRHMNETGECHFPVRLF